jgi:hypothetical protein
MAKKKSKSKKYTTVAKIKKLKSKSSKRSVKRSNKKSKSKSKKQTPWIKHVTNVYKEMKKKNPDAKLGDAMKEAKKTYKK